MRALALNAGSSSLKAALYELETLPPLAEPPAPVQRAEVDAEPGEPAGGTVRRVLEQVGGAVDVVGHRVVHGGEHFREPTRVTDEVRSQIGKLSASAPLHNAAALEGVEAAEGRSRAQRPPGRRLRHRLSRLAGAGGLHVCRTV
jgi:acetate kinase